jgi:hypothetical protein
MRKLTLLLSVLTWIVLFGCGGGGGGGGGGTSDTGTTIIYSSDYTNRDLTKVYTFKDIQVDTTDGKNTQSENTISYSYEQNVAAIPGKYGYSGTIPGPYTVETMALNGVDKVFTYLSYSSMIISDDSSFFTTIDHSDSTGVIPPDWTVGTVYTESSAEDLFSSASGLKVGTKETVHTLKALVKENVTVQAGTFEAVKTQETSTITITLAGGTEIKTTTWSIWYGKSVGLVKIVANTTDVITAGSPPQTSTYTVTDELTKRE